VLLEVPAYDFSVFEAERPESVQGTAVDVLFVTLVGNGATSAKGRHDFGGFKVARPPVAGQGEAPERDHVGSGCIDKGPAGA